MILFLPKMCVCVCVCVCVRVCEKDAGISKTQQGRAL